MNKRFYDYDKVMRAFVEETAKECDCSRDVVVDVYENMFDLIRTKINDLGINNDTTVEELKEMKTTFMIPKLGKLYANEFTLARKIRLREDKLTNEEDYEDDEI